MKILVWIFFVPLLDCPCYMIPNTPSEFSFFAHAFEFPTAWIRVPHWLLSCIGFVAQCPVFPVQVHDQAHLCGPSDSFSSFFTCQAILLSFWEYSMFDRYWAANLDRSLRSYRFPSHGFVFLNVTASAQLPYHWSSAEGSVCPTIYQCAWYCDLHAPSQVLLPPGPTQPLPSVPNWQVEVLACSGFWFRRSARRSSPVPRTEDFDFLISRMSRILNVRDSIRPFIPTLSGLHLSTCNPEDIDTRLTFVLKSVFLKNASVLIDCLQQSGIELWSMCAQAVSSPGCEDDFGATILLWSAWQEPSL